MLKNILSGMKERMPAWLKDFFDLKSEKGDKKRCCVMMTASAVAVTALVCSVVSDYGRDAVKVLYYADEPVGVIESCEVYENAKTDAEKIISDLHGIAYKLPSEAASYRISVKNSGAPLSQSDITQYLVNCAEKQFSTGYGLYVDNTLVAVGENPDDVQSLLDETVALYNQLYAKVKTPDDIVVFASKIKIEKVTVPNSLIKSKEEIRKIIGLDSMENLNEVLLLDSSLSDEMTIKDISDAMPEIPSITETDISLSLPAENIYYVGAPTADAAAPCAESGACMSFKSSSIEVVTEVLECGEEIIYDDTLTQGKKVLVSTGVYGIKEATYDVTYIDGVEVTRTLIGEKIVKEPVSKVYKVGTKKVTYSNFVYVAPGDTAPGPQGFFIMPTSGQLTSTFSGRTIFGKTEFHGAIDIANKAGTPVYASDGGTVIRADWFDSYGNCIIIDHGNGLKTLYAHLSTFSVKVGDVVGQGWQIGSTGRTGRATGPHLHFEVILNGEKVDPMLYLN